MNSSHHPCRPVVRFAIAALIGSALLVASPIETVAQEKGQDDIEVRNPKALPGRIPCQRTRLGKQGDYKPCIARLPGGELLVVAFDAQPEVIYVEAEITHTRPVWQQPDGDVVETKPLDCTASEPMVLVGCRFRGRLT